MSAISQAFDRVVAAAQACDRCERMCGSVRVLSWANGAPGADVMFIAEAPGRLGADRTAIPLHGDAAGDNFERLLGLSGLRRAQIFVTNAVLCNPRDAEGNNAAPSSREVENCAHHLAAQIAAVQPAVIVTLGSVALRSLAFIEPHSLSLRQHVRTAQRWHGCKLIPLYHPGARALIHRSFANQTADYYFVGETVRRLKRRPRSSRADVTRGSDADWAVVQTVLERSIELSLFRLHKLLYLTELEAVAKLNVRATGFLYLRQKDGPYCVELGSRWYGRFANKLRFRRVGDQPWLSWARDGLFDGSGDPQVPSAIDSVVSEIIARTSEVSDAQLKTRAYLTSPMKDLLRRERLGESTLNQPIQFRAA